jgi:nitroreductase
MKLLQGDFRSGYPMRRLKRMVARLKGPSEFWLDSYRYFRHAAPQDGHVDASLRGRNLECQLTKDYHRVEKGLALRAPRAQFGSDVMARLGMLIPVAKSLHPDASYGRFAEESAAALTRWNGGQGIDSEVAPPSESLPQPEWDPKFVDSFFNTRRSVRQFDPSKPVSVELLESAVRLASSTPSVCNRQPWKVRFFTGNGAQQVLKYQNGNSGFRNEVPCVALITVDSRLFAGANERNQPWIEGGIFAMSLVYALHGLGLQTCMLNMSVLNSHAASVRKAAGAEDAEQIIMMVAVGHATEKYRVARSPRRTVAEIMEIRE